MKTILLYCFISFFSFSIANAQQDNEDPERNGTSKDTKSRFWEARLPGGEYMVALSHITSVSKHTYFVGSIMVTEVVIDTNGNSLARFYAFSMGPKDGDSGLTEKAQSALSDQESHSGIKGAIVTKDYPKTTHAKTVEYLLADPNKVDALMKSCKRAWKRNKGARFSLK